MRWMGIEDENARADFRAGAKFDGVLAAGPLVKALQIGDSRIFRFCFSDQSVDRMGDVIHADGWNLNNFQQNAVALWAHDSSAPPIGRAANVHVQGERLVGDIEFAAPDVYEFADTVFKLVRAGYISAVSVGFMPLEYDFAKDKARPMGIDFLKQELLEISVCPVPANANALIEARAAGIDVAPIIGWAERVLDTGGKLMVSKKHIRDLEAAARLDKSGTRVVVPDLSAIVDAVVAQLTAVRRDGDEDTAPPSDIVESLHAAHAYAKAAETMWTAGDDHHENCMKSLRKAMRLAMPPDGDDADGDGDAEPKPNEPSETARAAAKARLAALR